MPGEEPVSQFCDGFKTLAVQSGPASLLITHSPIPLHIILVPLLSENPTREIFTFPHDIGLKGLSENLHLRICVFRI
jgi:hypothetical protein